MLAGTENLVLLRGQWVEVDRARLERTMERFHAAEELAARDGLSFAEAMRMLETGVASARDIDRAMELGYRHPMGPLKLTVLVGLDVRLSILEHLQREIGEQFRPPGLLRMMVRAGKLGKKTGQGFYTWKDGVAQ